MIPVESGPENSGDVSAAVEFHYIDQEDDVLVCYPLIRQLRPHLDKAIPPKVALLCKDSSPHSEPSRSIRQIHCRHVLIYSYTIGLPEQRRKRPHPCAAPLLAQYRAAHGHGHASTRHHDCQRGAP